METKKNIILFMSNFVFGAEDSLVSTVGMLSGIASAGIDREVIVISGIVLIFVEAFSMSVGSFLSERVTEEYQNGFNSKTSKSLQAAIIMLFSYFISGLIPLLPYIFLDVTTAFWQSIVASLVALFGLGYLSARILRTNLLKNALRMMVIGGTAVFLGVVVGMVVR